MKLMNPEKDKILVQFFEEIKEVDQSMLPAFDACIKSPPVKRRSLLRRHWSKAAAIALAIGIGLGTFLFQRLPANYTQLEAMPITEWQSPTDFNLPSLSSWQSPTDFSEVTQIPDISGWQSPTDFLLQTSN